MNQFFKSIRLLIPALALFITLLAADASLAAVEITGTMGTGRLIKTGADECYSNINNINNGDFVKMLGRNGDGSWVFIWADAGDGWVPTSTVNADSNNIFALGVWNDHFTGVPQCASSAPVVSGGAAAVSAGGADSRICGREGQVSSGATTRWTHVYTTADPELKTDTVYAPGTPVEIIGRDFWGCWLAIGNGEWLPSDAIDTRETLGHPILIDNSDGCSIANLQVSCPDA